MNYDEQRKAGMMNRGPIAQLMAGAGIAPQQREHTPMENANEHARSAVKELEGRVERLFTRLQPVMSVGDNPFNMVANKVAEPPSPNSTVTQSFRELADRVEEVTKTICIITDRLEV